MSERVRRLSRLTPILLVAALAAAWLVPNVAWLRLSAPDPVAAAMTASAAARTALDDAANHGALKRNEVRDLESHLDRFDRAIEDGDTETARREADRFAATVDDRIGRDHFPEEDAAALRSAAEDLVAAAFNDAAHRVEGTIQEKMGGMTAGMGLPPGFKLPF